MTDLPALIREHRLHPSGDVLRLAEAAYDAGVADARKPRPGGRPAYGQTDEERAVLRDIWGRHAVGQSFARIARDLDAAGTPTPSGRGRWDRSKVAHLVRRLAQSET